MAEWVLVVLDLILFIIVEWGMVALMSLICCIYGKEETHKVYVLTIEVLQFWGVEGTLYLFRKKESWCGCLSALLWFLHFSKIVNRTPAFKVDWLVFEWIFRAGKKERNKKTTLYYISWCVCMVLNEWRTYWIKIEKKVIRKKIEFKREVTQIPWRIFLSLKTISSCSFVAKCVH